MVGVLPGVQAPGWLGFWAGTSWGPGRVLVGVLPGCWLGHWLVVVSLP